MKALKFTWGYHQHKDLPRKSDSPARADSSSTFFYSMSRKASSMKGLDKGKWERMRIGSVIPPPHLFKMSFSYQIVLIHYLLCFSICLIWKCSFFRVAKTTTYFQKYHRGMNCYGKSGRNFARRQETSVCYFYPSLCVCVCGEVWINIHVMRISAGGHACLYSSCLDCLFWHTHCLLWYKHSCLWYCIGNQIREQKQFKNLSLYFYFPW